MKKKENQMDKIKVAVRDLEVKAKKMRRMGMIPGSVFGKALPETILIQMEEATARKLMRQKREGSKLVLNIDGKSIQVQIKEKSINTLTGEILHISFQALTEDEKVNSVIHLFLKNHEKFGGQIEKMFMEIPYASLPEDMIDTITIDVDNKKVGDIVKVRDIPELISEKIELQTDLDEIVFRISEKQRSHKETADES